MGEVTTYCDILNNVYFVPIPTQITPLFLKIIEVVMLRFSVLANFDFIALIFDLLLHFIQKRFCYLTGSLLRFTLVLRHSTLRGCKLDWCSAKEAKHGGDRGCWRVVSEQNCSFAKADGGKEHSHRTHQCTTKVLCNSAGRGWLFFLALSCLS